MFVVEPGSVILVRVKDNHYLSLTYDQLVNIKPPVSKRSRTPATKLSRQINLLNGAVKRGGIWANGSEVDISKAASKIKSDLVGIDIKDLTDKGRDSLLQLRNLGVL